MKKKSGRETKASLLSRQKPTRRRSKRRFSVRQFLFVIGLVAVSSGGVYLYNNHQELKKKVENVSTKPKAWNVSLRLDEKNSLSEKEADLIIATARNNLGSGSQSELEKAAKAVQRLATYSTVHILRTAIDTAVVQLRRHTPVACIEADQLRFITSEGHAYGTVKEESECPGPLVKGIFANRRRPQLSPYGILDIDEEERQLIQESLELYNTAKAQDIVISHIEFKPFRGFVAFLANKDLEVALGRPPFASKLSKLNNILIDIAQKGEQPLRIELDYQGKAFIKFKKM